MARIPEAELEKLKAEVSLERLAAARGIELRRHGADLLGLCPFHDDHASSLVISPRKNLWHCLGACQAGGSVIDWVMRTEGVSFRHAVELLRTDPALATSTAPPRKQATVPRLPSPVARDAADSELLGQVAAYYHATLSESPEALAYLQERGLHNAEAIEHFQLGFANRTLGLRLPEKNRREGAAMRSRLQALGILRESGHEHFNGSLVVPVFDEHGVVSEMYGRKITANLRAGTPLHLYLPGEHHGVWNLAALQASSEVILCEALLDAMTLWCLGFRNVTAAYGVEGFTADHLDAFTRWGTERVLIAYDRDAAGDRAAVQLAVRLVAAGIDSYRVRFPPGEDANSLATAEPDTAAERIARCLRSAAWLGQGRPRSPRAMVPPGTALTEPTTPEDETAKGRTIAPSEPTATPAPVPPFAADQPAPMSTEPPPATPLPQAPATIPLEAHGEELVVVLGDRQWRVRGHHASTSFDSLRITLLVRRLLPDAEAAPFHVDTLDLYSARQRAAFTAAAGRELGIAAEVIHRDLGLLLVRLEEWAEERARLASTLQTTAVTLSAAETAEAMALLRDPELLTRLLDDFDRCGVVGEETNKLVAYLAATSRLLDQPLAVVVQSTSAAGKSVLLDAVLAFLPEEARIKYSAMTGQSLFYMAEQDLAHKVLAVVEEAGAERAAYALKLLQSEGELSIASTGKDAVSGRLVTHEYSVRGPVALFLTTTALDVDEELLNRCLVLSVDEERAQTRAIHERQRSAQTLAGLLAGRDIERIRARHHNAQRLLQPLLVANPYAEQLRFANERTRTRRDHQKYLTLIRAVALLHQHQREHKTVEHEGEQLTYIEVSAADIAIANRLAHEVLGRSLDELPPQTRRVLLLLDARVNARAQAEGVARSDVRFSRREVREWGQWESTQLACHLSRLVALEYLLVHRGSRGQSFVYELLWDGEGREGERLLSGLLDPSADGYDANLPGYTGDLPGPSRPHLGLVSGRSRTALTGRSAKQGKEFPSPFAAVSTNGTLPGSGDDVVAAAR